MRFNGWCTQPPQALGVRACAFQGVGGCNRPSARTIEEHVAVRVLAQPSLFGILLDRVVVLPCRNLKFGAAPLWNLDDHVHLPRASSGRVEGNIMPRRDGREVAFSVWVMQAHTVLECLWFPSLSDGARTDIEVRCRAGIIVGGLVRGARLARGARGPLGVSLALARQLTTLCSCTLVPRGKCIKGDAAVLPAHGLERLLQAGVVQWLSNFYRERAELVDVDGTASVCVGRSKELLHALHVLTIVSSLQQELTDALRRIRGLFYHRLVDGYCEKALKVLALHVGHCLCLRGQPHGFQRQAGEVVQDADSFGRMQQHF